MQQQISHFLKSTLHFYVRKVSLTHRSKGPIKFLGHLVQPVPFHGKVRGYRKELEAAIRLKKKVLARLDNRFRYIARIQTLDMRRRFVRAYRVLAENYGLS